MTTLWRLAWDDEGLAASEPLSLETLQRLASSGKIQPQTLVREEGGDPEWRPVSAVAELYGALFGDLFDDLFGDAANPAEEAPAPAADPEPAPTADPNATPPGEFAAGDEAWEAAVAEVSKDASEGASPPAIVPTPSTPKKPAYDGPPPTTSEAFGGAMSALGGTLEKKARQAKLHAKIMKIESMDKTAAMERLGKGVAALVPVIEGGEQFVKEIRLIEGKAAEQDAQAKGIFGLKAKGVAAALRRRLPDLYLRLADLYLAKGAAAPQRDKLAAELAGLDDCARRVAELRAELGALKGEMEAQSEANREARGKAAAFFKNIGKSEPPKKDDGA